MNKKKILLISHVDSLGGAEQVFKKVLNSIKEKNEVFVVLNTRGNGLLSKKMNNIDNIEMYTFGLIHNNIFKTIVEIPFTIIAVWKIIKLINEKKIDIIYSNTSANLVGILAAKITGKRHIWHIHEQFGGIINKKFKIFYKILSKYKKNEIIFISKTIASEWSFLKSRNKIIHNPVKKYNENSHLNKKKVLGFAGSLVVNKNAIYILEGIKNLEKELGSIKLVIAGDGEERNRLERYSNDNNLNVDFMGRVDDMNKFYQQIDILIIPSFSEGVPLVALDAMNSKKIVVITKNNGIKGLFEENKEYLTIDPTDVKSFEKIIKNLIENKIFQDEILKQSYKGIKKYLENNKFSEEINQLFFKL